MKYPVKSILFLGIGGVSMHQLAIAMKDMGVKVFGYDQQHNKYTKICEQHGIKVSHKFVKEFCAVDVCVATGGFKHAKYYSYLNKNNIPILDRAEVLGWISQKFKTVIAVAGTHGKSTTATLIYEILRTAGKNVSCHIGADVRSSRFSLSDEILVVEACEYNKSFLKLKPTYSVVTNVEQEHMDSYGNFFNLRSAFLTFLKRGKKRFVFKEKSTDFFKRVSGVDFVEINNSVQTKLKGEYNLKNVSLAVEVCKSLGVGESDIKQVVSKFSGIPRRYQYLGEYQNGKIYLDYAHHPTEIKSFLTTFKEENTNIQIIFQPHTYSRTKSFFNEFVSVLSDYKNLIIYKEYPAREKKFQGKSAKDLFLAIKEINPHVKYCTNEKMLITNLLNNCSIAFVGAGDINLIAESLVLKAKF